MKCENCGKEIGNGVIPKNHLERNKTFYCNKECFTTYSRKEKLRNYDFFTIIDTEEKAYWMGFIYADGNVSEKHNLIQIRLSERDISHLRKMSDIFGKEIFCGDGDKGRRFALLSLNSIMIKKDMLRHNIFPRKTYIDSDKVLDSIPHHLLHHFIRGFFDGDGCISVCKKSRKNCYFGMVGTKKYLKSISDIICRACGVSVPKMEKRKGCFVIRWSGKIQIRPIYDFLYKDATVFLERKKDIFDNKIITSKKLSSIYRGVTWSKLREDWQAQIMNNYKKINLGHYTSEKEAALAYDFAVISLNKPLYKLNFREA